MLVWHPWSHTPTAVSCIPFAKWSLKLLLQPSSIDSLGTSPFLPRCSTLMFPLHSSSPLLLLIAAVLPPPLIPWAKASRPPARASNSRLSHSSSPLLPLYNVICPTSGIINPSANQTVTHSPAFKSNATLRLSSRKAYLLGTWYSSQGGRWWGPCMIFASSMPHSVRLVARWLLVIILLLLFWFWHDD